MMWVEIFPRATPPELLCVSADVHADLC